MHFYHLNHRNWHVLKIISRQFSRIVAEQERRRGRRAGQGVCWRAEMIFLRFIGVWFAIVRWFIEQICKHFLPRSRNFGPGWWERGPCWGRLDWSYLMYLNTPQEERLNWQKRGDREDWSFRERVALMCVTVTRYIQLQCSQGVIITLIWDREQSHVGCYRASVNTHHTRQPPPAPPHSSQHLSLSHIYKLNILHLALPPATGPPSSAYHYDQIRTSFSFKRKKVFFHSLFQSVHV